MEIRQRPMWRTHLQKCRYLPYHAVVSDGGKGRRVVGKGRKNLFGHTVDVIQMQSEAGAAGTCHGALQAGALTTTFTSAQGLMLMIPVMYAMGGQFLPNVMHIASRVVTSNHHSIFGDHSDFMTCRMTGYAMLMSSSPAGGHGCGRSGASFGYKSQVCFHALLRRIQDVSRDAAHRDHRL